jgi:two-component system CitB family sensor kinase
MGGAFRPRYGLGMADHPWYRRLFAQTLALQLGMIALVLLVAGFAFARQAESTLEEQHGLRSLAVAESVAAMPIVRDNITDPDSASFLQPIAESVRTATEVSFVVIADVNGIRRSHPNSERIGQKVSTDPSRALAGISDVYVQEGTLGPSVRGKVPVYNEEGEIVGLVSVGILSVTVAQEFRDELPAVLLGAGIAMLLGALGAWILARRIRNQTHGLEPADIAALYERREAMLLGIREGVIGLDPSGRLNLVNREATRLLGLDERSIGKRPAEVIPSPALERLLSDSTTAHHDVKLSIADQVVVANVMPVEVRNQHIGTVVTLRDRTELDSLVGELESVQVLVDALRSQAHEFSNTLHTISGLIELGRTETVLDVIYDHTATHQRLTSAYERQIGDPLLIALLLAKSAIAAERGITIVVEIDGLDEVKLIEAREMITILGNLVDNALDSVAGPRNNGGTVSIELCRQGSQLTMSVRDNGPGISEEVLDAMFQEGFTTKSSDSHSGIGLALVHNAVKSLNGTIDVERGDGAGFHVVLPAAFDLEEVEAK